MSKSILRTAANIGTFGLLGKAVAGGKKTAAPAATPAPVVMPTPDDQEVLRARRRSIAAQLSRGGRESTILTTPGSTLGG